MAKYKLLKLEQLDDATLSDLHPHVVEMIRRRGGKVQELDPDGATPGFQAGGSFYPIPWHLWVPVQVACAHRWADTGFARTWCLDCDQSGCWNNGEVQC